MKAFRDSKFALSWQRYSSIPLAFLGLAYLAVYALQVVNKTSASSVILLDQVSNVIWVVFAIDVAFRTLTSRSIGRFLRENWLELFALLIPFMRILRVFRVAIAIRGLRPYLKTRVAKTGTYVLLLLPLTWFTGAIAVLDSESSSETATIRNLADAMWWSLSTITTVGYGDLYPTTLEGKYVAATLMISGIALFSAGAAMFASWIMAEKREDGEAENEK